MTTACRKNDQDRVKAILAADPDAARSTPLYSTWYSGYALRSAAKSGFIELVELLLGHGANPNQPKQWLAPLGGTLYAAAQNGHDEVLKLLLDRGGNPNQEVESSGAALSAATSVETKTMLQSYGAVWEVFGCCYYGQGADFAKRCEKDPHVANDTTMFSMAAEHGYRDIVETFLKYQPDLWDRATVTLRDDAENNQFLLANCTIINNLNWLGIHPLHHGCNEAQLKLYIEHGVDLNLIDSEHQSTPLGWAARRGDEGFA